MARKRDGQASINAHDMRKFREMVVAPALAYLQPVPCELVGGQKKYLAQIARDNSHNSFCYQMRLSFSLAIGSAFESKLRLWLSLSREEFRPVVERADQKLLAQTLSEVKGATVASSFLVPDIAELWELVSTARHGDGPAARRLRTLNPGLWRHQDSDSQLIYDRAGLGAYSMRVQDADIDRYFEATIGFWESASRG